jgi:hypothetical protein
MHVFSKRRIFHRRIPRKRIFRQKIFLKKEKLSLKKREIKNSPRHNNFRKRKNSSLRKKGEFGFCDEFSCEELSDEEHPECPSLNKVVYQTNV